MIKNKIFTIKYFTRLQPILENEDSEEKEKIKHDEKLLEEELEFINNDNNYTYKDDTSWNCCRYFCYFLFF